MIAPNQLSPQTPALHRLLSDSALARAGLGGGGSPPPWLAARARPRPVTYVNAAFEAFFGYSAEEALGQQLAALLFRADEPLVHRLLAESRSRSKLRAWSKSGATRHVEISLGAVHSAEGELTHWVVGFSDRSEVENLRSELRALQALAATP